MSLKFNTFRAKRYLRSKFIEGKFLLASEATDLELEILDLFRQQTRKLFGEAVAVEDSWKVEKLSSTQLLIKPGEAWIQGLPFTMRGGKDQLVSGAILSIGTIPVGVSVADDSSGLGKVITFNDGATTPSNTYRMVVTVREELITEVQDPFLQNVNLTESTAQKIRVVFQLNIVPESIQSESPVPYRDENSVATDAGLTPTNFPDTGNDNQPNYVNKITVTPTAGVGELLSTNNLTGSEGIDGKNLELIIANPIGNNPIPNSPTAQAAFSNGKLIDSNGTEFHINFVTNDAVGGQVKIVIDKEYQQLDPVLDAPGGRPYSLVKRDVYVTDDVNGLPQGKWHWPIANLVWHSTNGLVHESSITDLRSSVKSQESFQDTLSNKLDLFLVGGGDISWDAASSMLNWTSALKLINPYTPVQTVASAALPLVDGGSLIYKMDLDLGGAIGKGTLAISSVSSGTSITLTGSPDLSNVQVGNVVVDDNGNVAAIIAIDDVNDVLTVDTSLTFTSVGTIYMDSYAAQTAPKSIENFVLAVRDGSKVYLGINDLELESGETSQLGDGISTQLLTYMGASGETDSDPNYTSTNDVVQGSSLTTAISRLDETSGNMQSYTGATDGNDVDPNYSSTNYVTQGNDLTAAISELDLGLDALATTVTNIQWKAPVANYASLPAVGNVDGDIRLVLDTRVAYHWNGSTWLPLTGTGSGLKLIGGGTVSWNDATKNLTFTESIYIEKPGVAYTDNTILTSESPINFPNNYDVAYVEPNLLPGGGPLSVTVTSLDNVPPTGVVIARRDDELTGAVLADQPAVSASDALLSSSDPLGYRGQQVFPDISGVATSLKLRLFKDASLTGTFAIDIQGEAVGEIPDGVPLDTIIINVSSLPNAAPGAYQTYSLNQTANLSFGTNYWLVFRPVSFGGTGSVKIEYGTGQPEKFRVSPNAGATWQPDAPTVDLTFEITTLTSAGSEIVVGSSSTRLKDGQSTKLYAQSSDQVLSYMGALDTADSTPAYSSDIRGLSGENLTARLGAATDSLGDAQEDRSSYLRSNEPITWTGASIQFPSDIVLEIVNTKSGTVSTHTIQTAASPITLGNGESVYVAVDRTQASEILSVVLSGTTPIPAQSQANKDIFVIARRQDVASKGYLYIPLSKETLEPGQSKLLGSNFSRKPTINLLASQTNTVISSLIFDTTIIEGVKLNYKLKENTTSNVRVGTLLVATDGTNVGISDVSAESDPINISFDAQMNGSNLEVTYTSDVNTATLEIEYVQFLS